MKPGLEHYLSIPYVVVMEPVRRADGEWVRRAAYPELGCVVEADSALGALEQLEQVRMRRIRDLFERGQAIPAPRDPVRVVPTPLRAT
jgi:hypothetical protein